jgi:signal transduction histidine kinase
MAVQVGRIRTETPRFPRVLPPAPAWLRAIGIANLLATVVFSVAAIYLVRSQPSDGGSWAYVMVLLAVLPLLAMRRHPVLAPAVVAAATLTAQLTVGPLITCGVVLPVIFVMTFQLGSRPLTTRRLALGGLGVVATALVELLLDPVLGTVDAAIFIFGLATTFFIGGLLVRSRVRMTEALRRRTMELAEQRDRTAALAVAADRERVSADLEISIRSRVAGIAAAAAYARGQIDEPRGAPQVRTALTEIEDLGRQTLTDMRAVVGTLRDAPTDPPPGIDDLASLLRRATGADARLRLEGGVRSLSPNVELSTYRIVEQLLSTLTDDPRSRLAIGLRFDPEALRIEVTGPARTEDSPDVTAYVSAALTAARTRAEVVGGDLETAIALGRRRVEVVLPVPVSAG